MNSFESIFNRLPASRVAVFGDFCLDAYWMLDTGEPEFSVETGLPVRRVRRQRYSLGGAGNVVANLVDLGVGAVDAVALIGDDLFGAQMSKLLSQKRVNTEGVLVSGSWETLVYSKPMLGDEELNRVDFGAFNQITAADMDAMAARLDAAAARCGVIVLNQQLPVGVSTEPMIQRINQVIAHRSSCRFIVDARHRAALYRGAMLKMNHSEGLRLLGQADWPPQKVAAAVRDRTGQTMFLTAGENGIYIADPSATSGGHAPARRVTGPVDPVGAGDTVVSALAAALAAGADPLAAAHLANAAAAVTVKKLKTTGTATPDEIRALRG
jgi:rfaE bifunctional protein kinase chain/domain